MDQTETLIAQNHQCIRESYLAIRHLRASVARANEAIAKSLKIIEQHRVSAPAMMDRADEATPVRDHHQVSRKAAMGKMAIDSDSRQMAAWIIQGLREAGFGCELLSQPRGTRSRFFDFQSPRTLPKIATTKSDDHQSEMTTNPTTHKLRATVKKTIRNAILKI